MRYHGPMSSPWRQPFENALAHNAPQLEVQVATVSPEGLPAVRTVTLRGLSTEGFPYFFTDARSRKADHLRENPRVALHAWFPGTREQFRLSGRATLHGRHAQGPWGEFRQRCWQGLEDSERPAFIGPPPGHASLDRILPEPPPAAPQEFLLVCVQVTEADWLRLGPPPRRTGFRLLGEAWVQQSLTP